MFHSLQLGMAHSASVKGSLLDDVFAVVSGVQCLILCCCDESLSFSFESSVLHPFE